MGTVAELAPRQLTMEVGGATVDRAILKLKTVAIPLPAGVQYKKGEEIKVEVLARVDEVSFADKHDKFGTITDTVRLHRASVLETSEDDASDDDDE